MLKTRLVNMAVVILICFPLKVDPYMNYFFIVKLYPLLSNRYCSSSRNLSSLLNFTKCKVVTEDFETVFSYLKEEECLEAETKGQLHFRLNYFFKKYTHEIVEK